MANTEERRFEVLRAIVADYVSNQEPVGSKSIVERHNLGVSSATVRNDMAALEEEGYIAQPHTSAGRIPTDKGYRLFVDRLAEVKPLSSAERRAITSFLDSGTDLDDVLRRSVRLLAQLTRQVAVVQYPMLTNTVARHLEVVPLTPARLMLVLITDSGRVDQRTVDLGDVVTEENVLRLRTVLNGALAGRRLADAAANVAELPERSAGPARPPHPDLHHPGRIAGRAPRGADRARRHRQPHPQRRGLPRIAAPGARSARGTGGRAEAARRGPQPRCGHRAHR